MGELDLDFIERWFTRKPEKRHDYVKRASLGRKALIRNDETFWTSSPESDCEPDERDTVKPVFQTS